MQDTGWAGKVGLHMGHCALQSFNNNAAKFPDPSGSYGPAARPHLALGRGGIARTVKSRQVMGGSWRIITRRSSGPASFEAPYCTSFIFQPFTHPHTGSIYPAPDRAGHSRHNAIKDIRFFRCCARRNTPWHHSKPTCKLSDLRDRSSVGRFRTSTVLERLCG